MIHYQSMIYVFFQRFLESRRFPACTVFYFYLLQFSSIFCFPFWIGETSNINSKQLVEKVFESHSRFVRPVLDANTTVNSSFGIELIQITAVVSKYCCFKSKKQKKNSHCLCLNYLNCHCNDNWGN